MYQKQVKLPPRTKLYGFDYSKNADLCMTGREWHTYAKTDAFKVVRDRDNRDATANGCEVYLDGTRRGVSP